jgi:hypothetical protein
MDSFLKVELDRLPEYSPWPGRIMSIEQWNAPDVRDKGQILREYGEKWGRLIEAYKKQRPADLKQALDFLFDTHFPDRLLFHVDEEIFYAETDSRFWNFFYSKIIGILNQYLSSEDTIVELGCGWGRNLFYFLHSGVCREAIGGEYTPEGLELGELIKNHFNLLIEFHHFDFRRPEGEFLKKIEGKVVFTHNSIEQINYLSKDMVLNLAAASPKVVIHFEPVYEYRDKISLLHFLWKRYTEINDYNRNLITVLKEVEAGGRIEIILEKIHHLGLNAFNPGSVIVWKPKGK